MPAPRRSNDESKAEGSVAVPWGIVVTFLVGLAGGGTSQVAGFMGEDDVRPDLVRVEAEEAKLRAEVDDLKLVIVGLRSDATAIRETIAEVRRIEEAAHPRVGVPDGPEMRYHREDDPRPPR